MIATDKFVFIHLPRSGGTFITDFVSKFFSSAHEIGHHMPRNLVPSEYCHLPLLGTVRNPWEFYVSLYHYILRRDATGVFASWMTEDGKLGFEGSVRNLLNLGVDNERLDLLIQTLPEEIDYSTRPIPSLDRTALRQCRGSGYGYYSFRFKQMFGDMNDVFFCRLETLAQDLLAFFERLGVARNELRDYLLNSNKVNAADHRHYSTYYTTELAQLVSIRDEKLIERFGYRFLKLENGKR
jgi:hypothetical protein